MNFLFELLSWEPYIDTNYLEDCMVFFVQEVLLRYGVSICKLLVYNPRCMKCFFFFCLTSGPVAG